jgi:hypothetical protein
MPNPAKAGDAGAREDDDLSRTRVRRAFARRVVGVSRSHFQDRAHDTACIVLDALDRPEWTVCAFVKDRAARLTGG